MEKYERSNKKSREFKSEKKSLSLLLKSPLFGLWCKNNHHYHLHHWMNAKKKESWKHCRKVIVETRNNDKFEKITMKKKLKKQQLARQNKQK